MTEFIGSRISLISKRDIRYVGTLHEINSENSTVALEQVVSYGTEGRRPDDEIAPSLNNVYEYIVFRGSDVKDLRIEGGPAENEAPKPPQIPDDPAIVGTSAEDFDVFQSKRMPVAPTNEPKPTAGGQSLDPTAQPIPPQDPPPGRNSDKHTPPGFQQQHHGPSHHPSGPPLFPQPPFPGYHLPPPNTRFGPQAFPQGPPGPAFPGMPYGGPPGWLPPYGFPNGPHGSFPPSQMPIGPPGQIPRQPSGPFGGSPNGQNPNQVHLQNDEAPHDAGASGLKPVAMVKLPGASKSPDPSQPASNSPQLGQRLENSRQNDIANDARDTSATNMSASGGRSSRLVPAVPLASPATKPASTANGVAPRNLANGAPSRANVAQGSGAGFNKIQTQTLDEANRDARAAVAAAMAKLPTGPKTRDVGALDHLANKINHLTTGEGSRVAHQPRQGPHSVAQRGGRGGPRRGGRDAAYKADLPKSDYDFESANAKFNKQDLVKEAIATGSAIGSPSPVEGDVNGSVVGQGSEVRKSSEASVHVPPGPTYDRSTSFFDNISSESKDRAQREDAGQRLGGREFRNEERQKNFETFGQGSVDNGYRRGGYRGRGRGGFRGGRGGGRGSGRGNPRTGRFAASDHA